MDIEIKSYYFLHCPLFYAKRSTLLYKEIDGEILNKGVSNKSVFFYVAADLSGKLANPGCNY